MFFNSDDASGWYEGKVKTTSQHRSRGLQLLVHFDCDGLESLLVVADEKIRRLQHGDANKAKKAKHKTADKYRGPVTWYHHEKEQLIQQTEVMRMVLVGHISSVEFICGKI